MRGHTAVMLSGFAASAVGLTLLLAPDEQVAADVGSVLAPPAPDDPAGSSSIPQTAAPLVRATSAPAQPSPAAHGFVPDRLVVQTLDLDAPLVTTLVDTDGAFVPPEDPAELGWWRGVQPGEGAGSVLVAGHIDARRYGQGPLARIVDLQPGDRAVLTGEGHRAEYVVRGLQTFPKESFPAADLFSTDGPERLILVTCGGTFDRRLGSWDSNVVAVLDPVAPA